MRRFLSSLAAAALLLAPAVPAAFAEDQAVVRAVLFYSPTCPLCHEVIDNQLPGIFDRFGGPASMTSDELLSDGVSFYLLGNGTVELLMVDVDVEAGVAMFEASSVAQGVPAEMMGVPRLVVGGEFYVGSGDIPEFFADIIEAGLASGGIDWPEIPGIGEALAAVPDAAREAPGPVTTATSPATTAATTTTETPTTTTGVPATVVPDVPVHEESPPSGAPVAVAATTTSTTEAGTPATFPEIESTPVSPQDAMLAPGDDSVWGKFNRDLAGNTLAVVVLLAMIASLVMVVVLARRGSLGTTVSWWVPLLAVAGVGVAVYLTYIETSGANAVCGPVGNCNAVQQSKYSDLFGFIPVGLVGLAGYAVVVGAWLAARFGRGRVSDWAALAMLAGTVAGVGFSIYLTFLEPFVIGATCIWCLSSAVIITLLMWLAAGPGWVAGRRLSGSRQA